VQDTHIRLITFNESKMDIELLLIVASTFLLGVSTIMFSFVIPNVETDAKNKTKERDNEDYLLGLMISDHREYQKWDQRAMILRDHLLIMEGVANIRGNEAALENLDNRETEMLNAMRSSLVALSPNMNIDLKQSLPRWNEGKYDYLGDEKIRLGKAWAKQAQDRHLRKKELSDDLSDLEMKKNKLRLVAVILQIFGLFTGFFIKIH